MTTSTYRAVQATEHGKRDLTEAATLVSQTHVPDDVYEKVRAQFSEDDIVKLTLLIATINAWNRISIRFRSLHPTR